MSVTLFSYLFLFFLCANLLVQFWLAMRQIRCVAQHQHQVPEQFASRISLAEHQKAAAYTLTRMRFSMFSTIVNAGLIILLTVVGGLDFIASYVYGLCGTGMIGQIIFIVAVGFVSALVSLPLDYFRQFVIEQRYGFNHMTMGLFIKDLIKNAIVSAIIGLPLLWVILYMMQCAGHYWWAYAWLVWMVFQIAMLLIYPKFIAPIFNKFTPLEDESLRARIESLMQRVGFQSQGLFVMDGSKRSAHGNAYFTGFGASKRVVFYDTLLKSLDEEEVEAVLAHELGHFKRRHILKHIIFSCVFSLVLLFVIGFLKECTWFYVGLGVRDVFISDAMALVLFMIVFPIFSFFIEPIMSMGSRKHEFEADRFAAENAKAEKLISALVKMYADNASTLTPDPVFSAFYDSHPNASIRVNHLLSIINEKKSA